MLVLVEFGIRHSDDTDVLSRRVVKCLQPKRKAQQSGV